MSWLKVYNLDLRWGQRGMKRGEYCIVADMLTRPMKLLLPLRLLLITAAAEADEGAATTEAAADCC